MLNLDQHGDGSNREQCAFTKENTSHRRSATTAMHIMQFAIMMWTFVYVQMKTIYSEYILLYTQNFPHKKNKQFV